MKLNKRVLSVSVLVAGIVVGAGISLWAKGIVCYLQCKSCFYEEKVYFGMGALQGYLSGYCPQCKKIVSRIVTDEQEIKNAPPDFMCPICAGQVKVLNEASLTRKLPTIACPKCGSKALQVQDRYEWE